MNRGHFDKRPLVGIRILPSILFPVPVAEESQMSFIRIVRVAACLLAIVVAAVPALAQGTGGGINGTVSDDSGGVLPGVNVTLTAAAGGLGSGQTTVTNDQGAYQFTRLVPGIYI